MLTDNEIREATEDSLKFTAFSETLAEIIITSNTPFTIGLYGEWGSGKTSLMRMTQNSLNNDNKIKTVWFDAWKFDKSHDLRVALIQSILREIEENIKELSFKEKVKGFVKGVKEPSFKNKIKDLIKRVNWMGLGMATVNQLLIKSMTFKELNEPLLKDSNEISQETLELIGDFEEKFREIIQEYVGNDGKFVVFIDDMDRCIPEKAIDILETIKLFLNSPHSVFVLGADKKVIENGIHQKYPEMIKDWEISYLDKIIQIPFFLPPLREEVIINTFIPKLPISEEIKQYKEIIAEVGGNPRTIKRLINQFELQTILAKKQEIKVDNRIMAKLTVIQFRHPKFHDTLIEMYVENETNLVEILRKLYDNQGVEKEDLSEWKSLEKYLNDKKFIKFLFEDPLLENIKLDDYVYLVKSMISPKDEKIDYIAIGNSFANKGDFVEAIKNFDKAIELDPNDVIAWFNKGAVLDRSGDPNGAIKCYTKVIELDPNYAMAWYNKGAVFSDLRNYDEALKFFDKTIELDPTFIGAWYNKGKVLENLEEYDEALKYFDKVIELDPNYAMAWYNKGNIANTLDEFDDAIKYYDKAIELDSNYAGVWFNKGMLLEDLNEYDEALKCFDETIELDPNYALAWYHKGSVLKKQNKWDEANKFYIKAVELDPSLEGHILNI